MSERYQIIHEKTYENILFRDFPVIPDKIRITFDNKTQKIVIQFKLLNVSDMVIDTVYLSVKCLDASKSVISSIDEHIISMVNAEHGAFFGEKTPIYLEDKRISGIDFIILKIVFKNGTTWTNEENTPVIEVQAAKPLNIPSD